MEILAKLGVDWKLLIAQIINFVILLFILRHFAYKPILRVLEDRREKIDKGLKDAEEATKKLLEAEKKEKAVLDEARYQAEQIISKSEETAKKNKEDIMASADEKAKKIMATAEKKIEEEKDKMIMEAKKELAKLVISATEKIIDEKVDVEKDKELINKAVS